MITSAYFDWVRSSSSSMGGLVMPSAMVSDTSSLPSAGRGLVGARTHDGLVIRDAWARGTARTVPILATGPTTRAHRHRSAAGASRYGRLGTATVNSDTPAVGPDTGLARLPRSPDGLAATSPRPCTVRRARALLG